MAWIRKLVALGLGLTIAAGAAVALNLKVSYFRETQAAIEHIDIVVSQITAFDRQFNDAGIAERGYMIMGEPRYLTAYKKLWADIPVSLNSLRERLANDPEQLNRLEQLGQKINERAGLMDDVMAMGPEKLRESIPVLRGSRIVQLSETIRSDLEKMRVVERDRRRQRAADASHAVSETALLGGVVSFLAIFSAAGACLLFIRQNRDYQARLARAGEAHAARLWAMHETATIFADELARPLALAMNYLGTAGNPHRGARTGEPPPGILPMVAARVEEATRIANRLRDHGGGDGRGRTRSDIASVIAEAVDLVRFQAPSVTIKVAPDLKLPPVLIDRVRVRQVLINLIENAMQACAGLPRCEIAITAARWENRMIRVQVSDNGPGVPDAAANQLFEPFADERKASLDLAVCQNIVRVHGGKIWFDRDAAAFCFTIPIADDDAAAHQSFSVGNR